MVDIDTTADGAMTFSLNDGDLTGTADYVVVDESTIEVSGFSLAEFSTSSVYDFAPIQLSKTENSWNGVMRSTSAVLPDDYDSPMYTLRFTANDLSTWGGYFVSGSTDYEWADTTCDWLGYLYLGN